MDSPAISRRGWGNVTPMDKKDDKPKSDEKEHDTKQKKGDKLLNDRRERIDKSDTNQPAFLRKIMD